MKKEDGSVVETVTNAADGTVTFSPISYDESQVGTHKTVAYDDEKAFENTYTPAGATS
ncbi:hypothetical protein HMPREF1515_1192, partial [Streptococcus sp. BS21]